MNNKVLLIGENTGMIDDIFIHAKKDMDCITSSIRPEDLERHMDVFLPAVVLYCAKDDINETVANVIKLKDKILKTGIIFAMVGDEDSCDLFQKESVYMADLIIQTPTDIAQIKEKLSQFLGSQEQMSMSLFNMDSPKQEEEVVEEVVEEMVQERVVMDVTTASSVQVPDESIVVVKRKHVLVIDDDTLMLKMIKEHLHEKYDVATAISGKIAYKFLDNKTTDLILLDYEMPVENGPQVFEKLRNNPNLANVPIVFLTGISEREKIQQALMLKPNGYLLKPIDKEKLLSTIKSFIG